MHQHNSASERVRIKGHAPSVIRFFFIAIAFMELWILVTSQLSYYSNLYGAQILLQLNIAFYLPSIPVLILSGHLEKLLDEKYGNTMSMMLRLNLGLGGCFIVCTAFPFLPETHTALCSAIAILGTLSAVAFSTTYQLVQWFRSADTIGLGIGCVGSGPLVLFFQLSLGIGSAPERWQLVAMYEIAAALVLVGLCSSLSLFHQYWNVLSGNQDNVKTPLMDNDAKSYVEEPKPRLQRLMTAPDPFMPGPLSPGNAASVMDYTDWDLSPPVLKTTASLGALRSRNSRHRPAAVLERSPNTYKFSNLEPHPSYAAEQMLFAPDDLLDAELRIDLAPPLSSGLQPHQPSHLSSHASATNIAASATTSTDAAVWMSPFGDEVGDRLKSAPSQSLSLFASFNPDAAIDVAGAAAADVGALSAKCLESHDEDVEARADVGDDDDDDTDPNYKEEVLVVLKCAWPVVIGFMASVTVMYLIFPFFTYVPTSRPLGANLPQVLFYTRLFLDIAGRFLPRKKIFVLRSPSLVLVLAGVKMLVAAAFFLYITSGPQYHHDFVAVGLVAFLWFCGGYLNTTCNILAPNMVPPALAARASAVMALVFQIAHFLGLVLAALVATLLFGDIVG